MQKFCHIELSDVTVCDLHNLKYHENTLDRLKVTWSSSVNVYNSINSQFTIGAGFKHWCLSER